MKFLWESNAPWAGTGYGQQTRLVLNALRQRGHEPTCFAFYGLHGGTVEYDGYPVLPNSNYEAWGNDVVRAHAFRSEAEAIVTLIDIFVLDPKEWEHLDQPWIAWVPIDSETMSLQMLRMLKAADYPIAMSEFGARQMLDVGVDPALVIPHALDPTFKPMERNEWREAVGLGPDVFLVGMVMANKGHRKQFPAQLEAVKLWSDKNKDVDVRVYIHTEPTSNMGGWDMKQVVDKIGLRGKVFVTNQYDTAVVPAQPLLLAQMYNSFDVLMNASMGEGFGIPIIEAQACGVPVITGNWTSMPELTHYGYCVEPAARTLGPHYGYHFIPSIEDMVYRLECVYRMANKAARIDSSAWALERFSVDVIADLWDLALQTVQAIKNEPKSESDVRRPTPVLTKSIKDARAAMDNERDEYGTMHQRAPEYEAIYHELQKFGFKDGDRVLDLGAADCDLDHFLRAQGWIGVYCPVDLIIDGTDLNDYVVPNGYDFIVLEQVIEHLTDWEDMLDRCEATGAVVIIATPNGQVVPDHDKHDMMGQMKHVAWITPEQIEGLGYAVTLKEFTGAGAGDTIIASKWNGAKTNGERSAVEVTT